MTFLPTRPPLARALAERNYNEPTPVQAAVLADDAVGRDLLVSAQTGSGKTVAYGLAIVENLLGDTDRFEEGDAPLALIVCPTRELALQVHRELSWLYQHSGARIVSCVGGMDPRREQRELAAGAHIVVGTPGRLCDHLRRGRLDVSQLNVVVLDEADEMLNMGFREDMEFLLEASPAGRRTLLFSATLPRGIVALAKQYQQQAFRIEVEGSEGGHADIEYRAIRVAPGDVEAAVVNVLRFFEAQSAIVFCNTRDAVRHLQAVLLERGFSVVALSGELTQNERTHALQSLRDGHARVCVATDVAARGIDLPTLGLVVNADLPHDPEVMQHRAGRTGRAGRKGVSVLLVPPARRRRAEMLLRQAGIDVAWGPAPQPDDIRKLDQERMLQGPLFTEEATEEDLTLARALLADRSPEDIAAALARLYRSRLPSPEDVPDPGERGARPRDDRGPRQNRRRSDDRETPGDDSAAAPASSRTRPRPRESMGDSIWFRAAVGRKKNAQARWLLPMICRRGGIDRRDIGAIRIFETSTAFEISAQAAEQFAARIARPDKDDSIRIEALPDGQDPTASVEASSDQHAHGAGHKRPERRGGEHEGGSGHRKHKPRYDSKPGRHGKAFGKPRDEAASDTGDRPQFRKERREDRPSQAGRSRRDDAAPFAKPAFRKKPKKDRTR